MRKALHVHTPGGDRRSVARKPAKLRVRPKLELIHGTPKQPLVDAALSERAVEVFDREGGLIARFSVVLEGAGCHNAEFEEVALIFAERSGRVDENEFAHLTARCAE